MATIIGLKELRENTEDIIERVAKGESIIIVKRSKPVLRLEKPTSDDQSRDAWLEQYIADNRQMLVNLADK